MSINNFLTPNAVAGEGEYAMASLLFEVPHREAGASAKRRGKCPGNALIEGKLVKSRRWWDGADEATALQGSQAKNAFLAVADGETALGKTHPMKCKWRGKPCAISI